MNLVTEQHHTVGKTPHPVQGDPVFARANLESYRLQKVVMFSRHNVRAPFADSDTAFHQLSANEWVKWSSEDAQLSMRGGALEVLMGQYFKKYFAAMDLFPENVVPDEQQVRVYSNSAQRTIATAKFLSSGIFPVANVPVEHHFEVGGNDPIFTMAIPFMNDTVKEMILAEMTALGNGLPFEKLLWSAEKAFQLMENVLDFKQSPYAVKRGLTAFDLDDFEVTLEAGEWPRALGTLPVALNASDALVLQYYEVNDDLKAAFGKLLSFEDWQTISHIKDLYCDLLFAMPTMAKILAENLIKTLHAELVNQRQLSLLVGHDINIGAILSAIGAYDYHLPYSVEATTPIGSKIVIEKWENEQGEAFANVQLVYFSAKQLRELQLLDLENPPMRFDLTIKGLEKNEDGLYRYDHVIERFEQVLNEVKVLKSMGE